MTAKRTNPSGRDVAEGAGVNDWVAGTVFVGASVDVGVEVGVGDNVGVGENSGVAVGVEVTSLETSKTS